VPVFNGIRDVFQTFEVRPNPVLIADVSLEPFIGVGFNSLVGADADILLYKHHAVDFCIF
jgi:hypothetical protein